MNELDRKSTEERCEELREALSQAYARLETDLPGPDGGDIVGDPESRTGAVDPTPPTNPPQSQDQVYEEIRHLEETLRNEGCSD